MHLDGDEPHIEFNRGKTGVYAFYRLWPVTAEMLRERIKQTTKDKRKNPEGLALLTEDGHPLVRYNENGSKIDSVRLTWVRTIQRATDVRPLGFKFLRKTVSTAVKHRSNQEVQQQMLAHSSNSVAGRFYTGAGDFQEMNRVLRSWYDEELKAVFDTSLAPAKRTYKKSA